MQLPVLPKWVTQVAAFMMAGAGIIEGLRATVVQVGLPIPPEVSIGAAVIAGVLALFGKALGDHDADGVPNIIDPDHPLSGGT
jgi:hypothetical protein